ncbi:hypothetical protein QYE76_058659 [Lolium multiflorum]|uniref:Nuclease HARBI1 n=1 Tax=Lolium multiflorum TaxID=4521 RepID=A0AAD8T7G2_LOLMU|nr:hypothetical protein QYE76_058659 [Lolium multiflorum]
MKMAVEMAAVSMEKPSGGTSPSGREQRLLSPDLGFAMAAARKVSRTWLPPVEGQLQLHKDYFHLTDPVFKEKMFRRRYKMSRELFLVILRGIRNYDPYFQCRPDATGALGFTSYQKCSAAIRMLSYGMTADIFDEYLQMGESTCLEAMYRFCRAVIVVFGQHYCRETNVEDTRQLLSVNESRGFPGMIGSIDCMHWD